MRLRKSAKSKLSQIPGNALVPGFFADIIDRNASKVIEYGSEHRTSLS